MRPSSPRHRIALAAAAAAILLSTGCANGAAGAAAFIGGQRVGNDQLAAEVEERGAFGERGQQSAAAADVLGDHILLAALDQLADDRGIPVAAADVDALISRAGGREALSAQGLTDFQIDGQARRIIVGEALIEGADPAEMSELVDGVREQVRRQFTEEGQSMGIAEDDLEWQVEEALAQQEPLIRDEASNRYLDEQIRPYLDGLNVRLSPRYGVIDPATLEIFPGASPLSAPAPRPLPPSLREQ